jgi:tRNA-2-methylthio-N6-dimethylallyladenosine synthase
MQSVFCASNMLIKSMQKTHTQTEGNLQSSSVMAGAGSKSPLTNNKKFYIKTFGCQMNVADSERMAAIMHDKGLSPAKEMEEADVILINGCSVREKAVHKAVSVLGQYNHQIKSSGRTKPIIGVGGCVGQLEKAQLFKQAPYLDFVFGTDNIDALPELLYRVENGEKHILTTEFDGKDIYSTETKVLGQKAQAFVNIMKGCDKYCTYCIVPFTRGREKSRTIDEVLDDCARLVASGVREITLLGQNVNSFGKNNPNSKNRLPLELTNPIGKVGPDQGEENFPQLLRAMDSDPRLAKLKRIRYTSSHPLDFSDELIDCYKKPEDGGVAKLAAHLHLPVQSGSNRVLSKMGRKHKIETYIAQMKRLKELNPEIGMSTDLIVGFPTETEEDFQETMKLLDLVQFDNIYAFMYSPRPGTRAAKLEDDVPGDVKSDRLARLLKHELTIADKLYAARVGKTMEILVEQESRRQVLVEKGGAIGVVWTGRTECNRVVNFVDDTKRNLTGKFLKVRITRATSLSLTGELIHDANEAESNQVDSQINYQSGLNSEIVG